MNDMNDPSFTKPVPYLMFRPEAFLSLKPVLGEPYTVQHDTDPEGEIWKGPNQELPLWYRIAHKDAGFVKIELTYAAAEGFEPVEYGIIEVKGIFHEFVAVEFFLDDGDTKIEHRLRGPVYPENGRIRIVNVTLWRVRIANPPVVAE